MALLSLWSAGLYEMFSKHEFIKTSGERTRQASIRECSSGGKSKKLMDLTATLGLGSIGSLMQVYLDACHQAITKRLFQGHHW